jgi:hypothetical protein
MTTTDFQHVFAAEINLGRRLVVELNAEPVRLVRLVERWADRRVLLVAPVQENNIVILPEPTGHQGIPVLEDLLVDAGRPYALDRADADVVQGFRSGPASHTGKHGRQGA